MLRSLLLINTIFISKRIKFDFSIGYCYICRSKDLRTDRRSVARKWVAVVDDVLNGLLVVLIVVINGRAIVRSGTDGTNRAIDVPVDDRGIRKILIIS